MATVNRGNMEEAGQALVASGGKDWQGITSVSRLSNLNDRHS